MKFEEEIIRLEEVRKQLETILNETKSISKSMFDKDYYKFFSRLDLIKDVIYIAKRQITIIQYDMNE